MRLRGVPENPIRGRRGEVEQSDLAAPIRRKGMADRQGESSAQSLKKKGRFFVMLPRFSRVKPYCTRHGRRLSGPLRRLLGLILIATIWWWSGMIDPKPAGFSLRSFIVWIALVAWLVITWPRERNSMTR